MCCAKATSNVEEEPTMGDYINFIVQKQTQMVRNDQGRLYL